VLVRTQAIRDPDMFTKPGVWPIAPRAFPVVAVEAGQVERTRRKDLGHGLPPSFCALQALEIGVDATFAGG